MPFQSIRKKPHFLRIGIQIWRFHCQPVRFGKVLRASYRPPPPHTHTPGIRYVAKSLRLQASFIKSNISIVHSRIVSFLYNTLILPYLSYCNIAWGNTFQSYLNGLCVKFSVYFILVCIFIMFWKTKRNKMKFSQSFIFILKKNVYNIYFICLLFCKFHQIAFPRFSIITLVTLQKQ